MNNLKKEHLEKIKSILTNKNLIKNFLEHDNPEKIIEKILSNPYLVEKILNIPETFWDEVIQKGMIVHSDLVYKSLFDEEDEDIIYKHMYIREYDENMPALAYQIKRNFFIK